VKWRFVVSMVRRELRVAVRRFGLYGSCMAIGIAVVVGLHTLREAVDEAVTLRSRELLGADLRLESRDPFAAGTVAAVGTVRDDAANGALQAISALALAPPTELTRLGSMALAERSGRSRLVDLMAIEGDYPIHGEISTRPPGRWAELGERPGLLFVDSTLLLQLDVEVGDRLRIGDESFEIAAAVVKAPGGFGLRAEIAPRVFLSRQDLERTGLLQQGSLVSYLRYFALPPGVVEPWQESHREVLEQARIGVQTVKSTQQDLSETFETLTRYLGLVGLAALVLGSIGVAAGVRVFLRERLEAVALLRSLGASPRDVIAIYAALALCLGVAAGVLGVLVAVPSLGLLPALLGGLLPVEIELAIGPAAMATGLGLSIWATLLCAVGPVLDLARISPLRALRRDFGGAADAGNGGGRVAIALALPSLLLASVWQAGDARVGLGFAGGLLATAAGLALAASLLIRLLRRHPPRGLAYWARQGIANLFRPRNHTLPTVVAIGFALFVVATVHAVQRNVSAQLAVDSRPDRPNFILFDIQRDQLAGVRALLAEHEAVVVDEAPLVSARLSGVADRSRAEWLGDETLAQDKRWALQREYRLTHTDRLRDSEEIVAGRWWQPGEADAWTPPYPVSVEQDLARSLGVGLGDSMTWQIQGVEIETRVMSLRRVDWGRMATNFFVIFPPAALETAPQSTVLLAHLAEESARAALQRDLVGLFPNVAALDATLILRSLDAMFEQIGTAVRILSLFTLATGIAILMAAAVAARAERAREALLLRILGASRPLLRRIVATEAIVLAAVASLVGGGLALLAAWTLIVGLFELPFAPPLADLLLLMLGTFLVTAIFGGAGAAFRPGRSPQAALREDPI
jgi:putative ABC transport system permease protein